MNEVMSYEDWLKGRRARRLNGMRVAPEVIRRKEGPDDVRLRKLYKGERGLPFPKAADLQTTLPTPTVSPKKNPT